MINSRIGIIYDRKSGRIIWGKNENKKSAMASTTKIMTCIVVIENANLNDEIKISAKAAGTGGSRLGLKKDDKITIKDLLYGLMLRSGNDAAVALAEYVGKDKEGFANLMNKKAKELGLKDTHFVTPHGLDDPEHYTTAYELAKIADYALKNEMFAKIVGTKEHTININGYAKQLCNTNELLGYLQGVSGVKTGFTNNAGRCLVTSVNRNDFEIITVVLGADTKKIRTADSINLIEYAYENYKYLNIEDIVNEKFGNWKEINKKRIQVEKGKNKTADIYQLFMETALNKLLSQMGVVSAVVSNKWMRAGYGERTREFLYNNCYVFEIIDLGANWFESATFDTNIITYAKDKEKQEKIEAYKISKCENIELNKNEKDKKHVD